MNGHATSWRPAAEALARAEEAAVRARVAADAARAAQAALVERAPRRGRLDVDLLERLTGTATALGESLRRAGALAGRFRGARARARRRRRRAGGGAGRGATPAPVPQRSSSVRRRTPPSERVTAVEVELARLDGESGEARRGSTRRWRPAPPTSRGRTATTPPRAIARSSPRASYVSRRAARRSARSIRSPRRSTRRRSAAGGALDPAPDLEASLAELAALRDELTETVNRRFDETFAAVAANFEDVASTLFPGGEGRLRLVEPDSELDGEAEAGIEVELRPAGKRITRLTLLSGGEKALGAISFLFALFLAKPCPFYLLDEVEARSTTRTSRGSSSSCALLRPGPVRRDHAPEADDGGRRRAVRGHDGRRRDLADRVATPAARGARRGYRLTSRPRVASVCRHVANVGGAPRGRRGRRA